MRTSWRTHPLSPRFSQWEQTVLMAIYSSRTCIDCCVMTFFSTILQLHHQININLRLMQPKQTTGAVRCEALETSLLDPCDERLRARRWRTQQLGLGLLFPTARRGRNFDTQPQMEVSCLAEAFRLSSFIDVYNYHDARKDFNQSSVERPRYDFIDLNPGTKS